jgi:GTPase
MLHAHAEPVGNHRCCRAGRPNVGKSALFNRIVGKSAAIVYNTPGVTRDRLYMRASWGGRDFVLVDTGGLMSTAAQLPAEIADSAMAEVSASDLPFAIERQAAAGISEADVVIMVCDGQEGPTTGDEDIINWMRKVCSRPCDGHAFYACASWDGF